MKKIAIIAFLILIGLVSGTALWFSLRRTPPFPSENHPEDMFTSEPAGAGQLIRLVDTQTPLRRLNWMKHLAGDRSIAQILTQADRQLIAVAHAGKVENVFSVPRPEGVDDKFFRFACLKDAVLVPDEALVLLYAPHDSSMLQRSLVLVLDMPGRSVRWFHYGVGEHLAIGRSGKETSIFLWGAEAGVTRLSLSKVPGEKTLSGTRSSARQIEWAPEVKGPSDLLPTGAWTFLVTHRDGLAAFLGNKGWMHRQNPDAGPLPFPEGRGRLVRGEGGYWWQPFPGQLVRVTPEAGLLEPVDRTRFDCGASFARDAQLMNLLGADQEGHLWFGLAAPILMQRQPSTPQPVAEEGWKTEGDPTDKNTAPDLAQAEREAWAAYIRGDLDRIYRWVPGTSRLTMMSWSKAWSGFGAPPDLLPPRSDAECHPGTAAILLGDGPRVFWLPWSTLPMGAPLPPLNPDNRTGSSR